MLRFCTVTRFIHNALDRANGNQLWSRKYGPIRSSAFVADQGQSLYFSSDIPKDGSVEESTLHKIKLTPFNLPSS